MKTALRQAKANTLHIARVSRYWASSSKTLAEKNVAVFSRGRSGSTALVSLMNSIPNMHCDGEILRPRLSFPQYEPLARSHLSSGQCYGFKLLSYQLQHVQHVDSAAEYLGALHNSGFKLVYLWRANILLHALSNLRAREFGFHKHDAQSRAGKITVNTKELFEWMEASAHSEQYEKDALGKLPFLEVKYERDIEPQTAHYETIRKLCDYLEMEYPDSPASPDTHKISPKKLSDSIENLLEVQNSLRNTRFETYLQCLQ